MTEAVTADLSLGSRDPGSSEMPQAPTITHVELIRRVALIHAAIDDCEMQAMEESAMKKRAEERDR